MHFLFTSPRNDQLGENNMDTKKILHVILQRSQKGKRPEITLKKKSWAVAVPRRVPHAGEKIKSMKYNIDPRQGLSIVCHRKV